MKKLLFIFGLLLSASIANAQCNTNTSICSAANAGPFTFQTPGGSVSTCLDFYGPNVGYIILNISGSGNLNMLIDGNSSSGFLDVAVFNVPPGTNPCTAIQSNSNQILCNYASSASGCAQFGGQFSCPANIGTVQVTAGQQLMIVVENWSGSSSSFSLQMSTAPGSATAGQPDATINPVGDLCVSGSPTQLSAISMGGTWSGPGVNSSGLFDPSAAGIGTHTISYSVGVAPCDASSTIDINVIADPVVNINANSPVCIGEDLTIDLNPPINGIYSWTGPNGFTSTQTAVLIPNVTQADAGTYSLTVDMWGTCSSTGSVDVVVSPGVDINFNDPGKICLYGTPVNLVANVTSIGNTTPAPGTWSGPGIVDPATGLFDPTVAGVGSHVIKYEVVGACGNDATLTVEVIPHPDIIFTSDITTGCAPLEPQVIIGSSSPIDSIFADFGYGQYGDSSGVFDLVYHDGECYDVAVWVKSPEGCTTDSLYVDYFCVQPNPIAEPDVEKGTTTEYDPNFVFIDKSVGATNWHWDFGNGKTSTKRTPIHSYPNEPGEYEVTLIVANENGCKDTASIIVKVMEDIVFYVPNAFTPDGDQFNNIFKPIMTSGFRLDSYTLLVYNRWGELLFESNDPEYGWDGTYQGKISQDGTYKWVILFKAKESSDSFRYDGFVTLIK